MHSRNDRINTRGKEIATLKRCPPAALKGVHVRSALPVPLTLTRTGDCFAGTQRLLDPKVQYEPSSLSHYIHGVLMSTLKTINSGPAIETRPK